MIEKLFTSKTRAKLLEKLLFNPEKEYHLREISRKTNTNPSHAKKELTKLKEAKLVKKKKKGNLTLYRANKESPIYNDLRKIYIKTQRTGKTLKEKLKNYNRIKYALIYGSFAKGKEKKTSDIDLLVVGKTPEKELHRTIMKLEEETGREINYILWTENEFKEKAKKEITLLKEIAKQEIIMIKGDKDEFRKTLETRQDKQTENQ